MSCRRLSRLIGALLALTLAFPAIASAAQPGVNLADPGIAGVDGALATGAKLIRMFVRWDTLEPDAAGQYPEFGAGPAYDAAIRRMNQAGAKPIFVVLGAPAWASGSADPYVPPDAARYADFFARFVRHTSSVGQVAAYEMWNEPDDVHFWHGGRNVPIYAAMVKHAYAAAKPAAGPAALLLGPTTGNNYAFIDQLYAAGLKGFFDGVSVHTDTGCLVNDPGLFYRDPLGHIGQYTFLGYRSIREVMLAHRDDKPIWMTELGWSSTNGPANSCAQGASSGRKPDGVTEAQQASYLTHAYGCLANDPYVVAALWFVYADTRGSVPEEHNHYGLVDATGAHKPAYDAFENVVNANGGTPTPCGDFAAPTIRIRAPVAGRRFSTLLRLRASASDHGGVGVIHVYFRLDHRAHSIRRFSGKFPDGHVFSFDWRGARQLSDGRHRVTVFAVDANGNKASKAVTVTKRAQRVG